MFGIGLPELILIMGVALIVVGPDKLPELAKSLAKGLVELKKTASSLKDSFDEELHGDHGENWRQNAGEDYPPRIPAPPAPDDIVVEQPSSESDAPVPGGQPEEAAGNEQTLVPGNQWVDAAGDKLTPAPGNRRQDEAGDEQKPASVDQPEEAAGNEQAPGNRQEEAAGNEQTPER